MPNVCHNTLEISGNSESISEIISKSKGTFPKDFPYDSLFSKFFPPPENVDDEWNVITWGNTKDAWFSEDWKQDEEKNKSVIYFDSAWVPATHFVYNLSKMYKDVSFCLDYSVYESCIEGRVEFRGGEEVVE